MSADERCFELTPGHRLQWEKAQGCYVILYPEGMVQLNDAAGEILRRIDPSRRIADIVAELQAEFPDAGEEIAADVHEFIEEARSHGWIREA